MKPKNSIETLKQIIREFPDVKIKKSISYTLSTSYTTCNIYGCKNDGDVIFEHISHMKSDYEFEGFEMIACKGFIKDKWVYANLLLRKKHRRNLNRKGA